MPQNYVPIFIFIAFVGVLIPITLLAAKLVRPDNPGKAKLMPYECGIDPVDSSRGRYTVRYYIVAILFVVFDVETIFLFPVGGAVQGAGRIRPDRDADFPAHPGRGLHLDLEKRRPGVGIDHVGTDALQAPRGLLLPDGHQFRNAEPASSETFTASRWTKGNLFFPVRIIVTPQHVSRVKSRLFGSNEESIALGQGRLGADFHRSDLVQYSHRFLRRQRSHHQPRASQGGRAADSRVDRKLPGAAREVHEAKA